MKGQLMLITAVIVSLIMITTGSAVSEIGTKEHTYTEGGYISSVVENESSKIDTRFTKDRENFRKMVGFLDEYTTDVSYWESRSCFNVTMENSQRRLVLNCIS